MPRKTAGTVAQAASLYEQSAMEIHALTRRYAEQPRLAPAAAERSHEEILRMLKQAVDLLAKHADKQNA